MDKANPASITSREVTRAYHDVVDADAETGFGSS